ncbi:MAG: hypothetical protein JST01_10560 [Cyanobacteria bacterium SZAS TMP-1]|nr:hypothetical protein [Cyanobacteria bacterium SZAS TMP-1]
MKTNERIKIVAMAATALIAAAVFCPRVSAEDQFARGCQLYNARSYSQALPIFNETVAKFPKFWPGHYYLANTLLAMGQRSGAKREYEACMSCSPPTDTLSACQKVLASLSGVSAAAPADSSAKTSSASASASAGGGSEEEGKKGDAPETPRDKDRRLQIERLRSECNDKIKALKAEMKERLAHGETNANQLYQFPDGTVRTSMTPEEEQAIEKEYQEKMARVKEETERRIAGIH